MLPEGLGSYRSICNHVARNNHTKISDSCCVRVRRELLLLPARGIRVRVCMIISMLLCIYERIYARTISYSCMYVYIWMNEWMDVFALQNNMHSRKEESFHKVTGSLPAPPLARRLRG